MVYTDIAPFFRLVDPPTEDAFGPFDTVEWAEDTIARIDFPWWRCNPYRWRKYEAQDCRVLVEWGDAGDGNMGRWSRSAGKITMDAHKFRIQSKGPTSVVTMTLAHEIGHMVDSTVLDVPAQNAIMQLMHTPPSPVLGPCYDETRWELPTSRTTWYERHKEAYADQFVEAFAPEIWNQREWRTHHTHVDPVEIRRLTLGATVPTPFTDIDDESPEAKEAIGWGYATGIIAGTTPTTFDGEKPVTRRQVALFLHRLYKFDRGEGGT